MNIMMMDSTLTLEQVSRFYRQGFLALPQITTAEDVSLIRELLGELFDRYDELPGTIDLGDKMTHGGEQRIPQINQTLELQPRLRETQYFKNASAIARVLLGEECYLAWDHAIYKPPHNGKETPWHQDLAYPAQVQSNPNLIRFGANFWMPLQDVTIESGCMQFIPHSNLGNLLPHHRVGHDPEVHTLETDEVDSAKAVACSIPAGGATIHQPKTLHYTGPNNTGQWRRAWILNFACKLI